MSKTNKTDKNALSVLRYDASRPYFGGLVFRDLYNAQGILRQNAHNIDQDGDTSHLVYVGKINGNIICDALWRQMSYNPVRFGNQSPFCYNGQNKIYRFCREPLPPMPSVQATQILLSIRHHLIDYMSLNGTSRGLPNGQWYDEIQTNNSGYISTVLRGDGINTGYMYQVLKSLRKAIQQITTQNVADLKTEPYRSAILRVISERNPESNIQPATTRTQKQNSVPVAESDYLAELAEARYDNMLDSSQITIDNREYVSSDTYKQAVADRMYMLDSIAHTYEQ